MDIITRRRLVINMNRRHEKVAREIFDLFYVDIAYYASVLGKVSLEEAEECAMKAFINLFNCTVIFTSQKMIYDFLINDIRKQFNYVKKGYDLALIQTNLMRDLANDPKFKDI